MSLTRKILACVTALIVAAPLTVPAQSSAPPVPFKTEEIDQLVAPIALYPDPLLAQILMASTYPLDVVQAARFAKENPNLKGDQLAEALRKQTWDDSVKSLVSFPQVLAMMDARLDWTQKLGDGFLAQQKDVMDAIQRLRARAQAEGTLKSTPEQKVTVQQAPPTVIAIQPANPQVVYVPTYNPAVAYGAWRIRRTRRRPTIRRATSPARPSCPSPPASRWGPPSGATATGTGTTWTSISTSTTTSRRT
jgi:hypothetical protein